MHTYGLPSAGFLNFVGYVQIIPTILAMMLSGNVHGGGAATYWGLVFAQWFVIGFGVSYPAGILVSKRGLTKTAKR